MNKLLKKIFIYILISFSILLSLVGGVFAIGQEPIQWMSYPDFMDLEGDKAWINPEVYVGYSAQFNSVEYSEYRIGNIIDGVFVEYSAVPLSEGNDKLRNIGQTYKVKIIDYYVDSTNNNLWYKVEPLEGYTLPEEFINNPYVLYLRAYDVDKFCDAPRLTILPKKAMLYKDSLVLSKDKAAAAKYVEVGKDDVPEFFDVTYVQSDNSNWYGYDLGDVSSWNEEVITSDYRYVDQSYVLLIPVDVTVAYEKLLEAETYEEYNEILNSIPEDIFEQFTSVHMTHIEEVETQLKSEVIVNFEETVMINGKNVTVSVSGNFVGDYSLSVNPVDNNTLLDEGFEIDNLEDVVTALDIKVVDSDGNEWQSDGGQYVTVEIDMKSLGYEDGRIFEFQHKHGDELYKYDVFVVMNGKLTYYTHGFSIFTVSEPKGIANADYLGTNIDLSLEVGKRAVYMYSNSGDVTRPNISNNIGKWSVVDESGAIYFVVHTNSDAGHNGSSCPWIEIVALKETPAGKPITLTYTYRSNNRNYSETYELSIISPTVTTGEKKLYIKDDVNKTGRIIATLVDEDGVDYEGLAGAAFTWERSDSVFITPRAFGDNKTVDNVDYIVKNSSINIAMDHAGLAEARKKTDGTYDLVTYKVKATLSNGEELKAQYTVYYQSEILNAGFESPDATKSNYTFFVNGADGLFWKTTAPGTDGNLTRDIEIGDITNQTASPNNGGTGFGVRYAGDYQSSNGVQFAELNAEAFGALYQDIITAPGEPIDWKFSHAARQDQSWAQRISNAMFIVIGATEDAQKLINAEDLQELGKTAKNTGKDNEKFLSGNESVTVTYEGAQYQVWYHNAGTIGQNERDNVIHADNGVYGKNNNYGWTELRGSYIPLEGQYRTRLFFVSEPSSDSSNKNAGNLIDVASAGQYKSYLIEYYEETFTDGVKKLEYQTSYNLNNQTIPFDEKGEALIYSSIKLKNLEYMLVNQNDYLQKILINGENCPYDIRYAGDASIYVENYPGKAKKFEDAVYPSTYKNNYDDYDLVVQIVVRDTVIAMQKDIEFPNKMTIEQKLDLITGLKDGYDSKSLIYSLNGDEKVYLEGFDKNGDPIPNVITIKRPDPSGNYTGYVSHNNNPDLDNTYYVEEVFCTDLEGLTLSKVKFFVTRYKYGAADEPKINEYIVNVDNQDTPIVSSGIYLSNQKDNNDETGYKIAEVKITNVYEEKMTTIHYKAVGNGKLKFVGDKEFQDYPTETLAFYTGKAKGAAVTAGNGATFKGWYKDEACTIPVIKADGVVGDDNSFKPNANIINTNEITFYAKFETNSIVIERENGEEGQTFIYHVQGEASADAPALDIYVSVTCNENGYGKHEIFEVLNSNITVTEMDEWSWRFTNDGDLPKQEDEFKSSKNKLTFTFNEENASKFTKEYWINAYSEIVKNIFGKAKDNE